MRNAIAGIDLLQYCVVFFMLHEIYTLYLSSISESFTVLYTTVLQCCSF